MLSPSMSGGPAIAHYILPVAPLVWVTWVPGNPSILEQWVPEPIIFGKKQLKCTKILPEYEQEIRAGNF